jgi:hypothetical protein
MMRGCLIWRGGPAVVPFFVATASLARTIGVTLVVSLIAVPTLAAQLLNAAIAQVIP